MLKSIIVTVEDPAKTDTVATYLKAWGMQIKWKISVVGQIAGALAENLIPEIQENVPHIKNVEDDPDVARLGPGE